MKHLNTYKLFEADHNDPNEVLFKRLMDIIRHESIEDFTKEINKVDKNILNYVSKYGVTLINTAVNKSRFDIIKVLIENGTDVNLTDEMNNTPLLLACMQEEDVICIYLINKGADVNKMNISGAYPLKSAIDHQLTNVSKKLIEKGADLNITSFGMPLIINAAMEGLYVVFKLMFEKGADISAKSQEGDTFLYYATDTFLYHFKDDVDFQEKIILKYPELIKSFEETKMTNPDLKSKYPHLFSGSDLNLL